MDFYFGLFSSSLLTLYGLVRKWNFFGIILTFLLLENVLCENAWEIPNNDIVDIQQEVQKISIIGYNKAKMTKVEIENEKNRIENECHCNVENLASVGAFILNYDKTFHRAASTLNLDPSKEIGVEDQIVTISNEEIPSDPDFNAQWALQDLPNDADINAVEGWREYLSDSNGGDPNGPSVVVAVIDTGVDYNHPDLKDVMWNNPGEIPGNGQDDDGNGLIDDVYGADFNSPPNGDPIDRHSHGTHCAGIIAAKKNNGEGIAGVASFAQRKVKIMAVKGLSDRGTGYLSNLLKSLNYAITNGAAVSSNSWGGGYVDDATEQLWKIVLENNPEHLFIAAAGNSNKFLNDNYKPMACGLKLANLLCVASSTQQDKKSWFSNYGKDYVHVFAPGSRIYSTIPNNRYAYKSGTSMACPHVSGLAALIRTMRPDMNAQQVKEVIEANVQKKAAYENVVSSGGIIDMEKSIRDVKDCPQGWKLFGVNCYHLLPQRIVTYSSAEKKCQEYGAELVSLETKDENNFVENMLNEARDNGILSVGASAKESTDIWLSARRPNTGSPFTWKAGSSLGYSDWHAGQPSAHSDGIALCMQTVRNSGSFWAWYVTNCDGGDIDNAVVCKKRLGCPHGWKIFRGVCYRLLPERVVTYVSAEKKCQDYGADLVSLETKDENDFLEKMLDEARDSNILSVGSNAKESTDVWLSARRTSTRSPFTWKTRSSLGYSDWHAGQPSAHSDGIALCMQTVRNSGNFWAWYVTNCDGGDIDNAVVCEKKQACNGGELLSIAPDGNMALCKDIKSNTCEKDLETICPVGWHLCNPKEFSNRNDGWSYATPALTFGQMYCRPNGGTSPFVITKPLNKDDPGNCGHYWSSRPGCDLWDQGNTGHACNNKGATALCCAPAHKCGNGVVDSVEEECDDGNNNELDDCLNSCDWRTPAQHSLNYCR